MKLEFDAGKAMKLGNPLEGSAFERLKRSLFTLMLRQKDKTFQNSQSPEGIAWAPIAPGSKARKTAKNRLTDVEITTKAESDSHFADHKILIDTGELKNSITSAGAPYQIRSESGEEIVLGTNVPYAAINNFGGTFLKTNKRGMGTYVTRIARPFMGFGDEDAQQVNEYVGAAVNKGLKDGG